MPPLCFLSSLPLVWKELRLMILALCCWTLEWAVYNQQCFSYRMLIRRTLLFPGGHMAPRSGGALRRHALRPVLLRTCKFWLFSLRVPVSVQWRLEQTPDEFAISCCPRQAEFFAVSFQMTFGEWLVRLFPSGFLSGSKRAVVARCLGKWTAKTSNRIVPTWTVTIPSCSQGTAVKPALKVIICWGTQHQLLRGFLIETLPFLFTCHPDLSRESKTKHILSFKLIALTLSHNSFCQFLFPPPSSFNQLVSTTAVRFRELGSIDFPFSRTLYSYKPQL